MNSDENEVEQLPDIDLDTVSLLVPKAQQGCHAARAELLAHVQDYMLLMARQHTPAQLQGKFGSSDVVQQSVAQVIQGFDNFRGQSAGEFYGWLRTIVTNEVKKLQRDYRRDKRNIDRERAMIADHSGSAAGFVPTDGQPTPRSKAIAAEQIEHLHEALDSLPDDYAEVIRLRSLERLPFKVVATRMNRSMDSVTKLWYRAIVRLQQELEPNDDSAAS